MNRIAAMLAVAVLAGCAQPSGPDAESPAAAPEVTTSTATASGTVEAIDATAGKITIAHGPVESLDWPAMTMNFKATPAQVGSVRVGQAVRFEFTSTGMDGTIVSIEPME